MSETLINQSIFKHYHSLSFMQREVTKVSTEQRFPCWGQLYSEGMDVLLSSRAPKKNLRLIKKKRI